MNHWKEERIEKLRPLLTLITDKINRRGLMMGAQDNRNWATNTYYSDNATRRIQGVLDRIGKVIYHRCFHIAENDFSMNPKRLGPDLYDHMIHCDWREPFGTGYGPNPPECLVSSMTKDKAGNWHMPCDLGIWISLWHPRSQPRQEAVSGCWNMKKSPWWRPQYDYTDVEVKESLQIMCEMFDWEYEEQSDSTYMLIS